ncbi:MAG TPA: DEAD/DEAH box helicase, partial [Chthonomonadales bacterium]|nr:DEAD/DEAH box helicase [Chthonomonadales bacterium]
MKSRAGYRGQIAHVEEIPPRPAAYAEPGLLFHPALEAQLLKMGIRRLYTHQAAAIQAVRRGEHVIVVSGTASGKTLCYNLPALEAILRDSQSRSLYLFPTKALA